MDGGLAVGRPEGALAIALGISQLLYLVTVSTLGIRLMSLAVRTRKLPESFLAVHFILCCGLGYLLLMISLPAAHQPGLLPPQAITPMIGVGHLLCCVGVFAGVCFNYLVFRPGQTWALRLVWLSAITMTTGYVGYGLTGGFSTGRFAGVWFWLFYGTYIAAAAWVMVEPLRYHGVMRRRLRLGLADPLVANRFVLWGSGSVCRFAMLVTGAVPPALFERIPSELWPNVAWLTFIAVAIAGLGLSVAYWLTFFPTRAYVRFVTRRHTLVES
jgi:hypothetical protein